MHNTGALDELSPNFGLRIPGSGELIAVVEDISGNWDLLDTKLGDFGTAWSSYAPVWAGGGPPSIGNGTIIAAFAKMASLVVAKIKLTGGSTTNWGGGNWTFSLPETPDGDQGFGAASAFDTSTGVYRPGIPWIQPSGASMQIGAALDEFGGTVPMTWATGDILRAVVLYEASTI